MAPTAAQTALQSQPGDVFDQIHAANGGGGDVFDQIHAEAQQPAKTSYADVVRGKAPATDLPLSKPGQWDDYLAPTERGLANVAGGAYSALEGMYNTVRHPIEAAKGIAAIPGQAAQVPGAIRDINAAPDAGGRYAQVAENTAGQGAGQAIVALGSEAVPKMIKAVDIPDIPNARAKIADALTTPKGTLKPVPHVVAKVGGTAVGAAGGALIGHPEVGAVMGGMAGPDILRAAIGDRTPIPPEDVFNARVQKGVENARVRAAVKAQTTPPAAAGASPSATADVLHVPEPLTPAPGEKPGSMYSVPRDQLTPAAMRGKPGALDVLRDLGQPAIVIPRDAGFPGARSTMSFPTEAAEPDFAYRVRDVGERGVPATDVPAHATTTLEDAQRIAPGREDVQKKPQEIMKFDLSKLQEGKDYQRFARPDGPDWIKLKRPLAEAHVSPAE